MTEHDSARPTPTRMCAACRERRPATDLLRFAPSDPPGGPARVDLRRRLGGRGLNLCPRRACLAKALKRSTFRRSLHAPAPGDLDTTARAIVAAARRELEALQLLGATPAVAPASVAPLTPTDGAVGPLGVGPREAWLLALIPEFTLTGAGGMTRRPAAQRRDPRAATTRQARRPPSESQ